MIFENEADNQSTHVNCEIQKARRNTALQLLALQAIYLLLIEN